MTTKETIAGRIAIRMRDLGLSYTQLGAACGVSENTARSWATGQSSPGCERLPDLARALSGDMPTGAAALYILGLDAA